MICLGRSHLFKFFNSRHPEILLAPFLSTLTHFQNWHLLLRGDLLESCFDFFRKTRRISFFDQVAGCRPLSMIVMDKTKLICLVLYEILLK